MVFEALQYLATLSPSETAHLIQDVYLFGSPIPLNTQSWASARRVVAGRLVNGYGTDDYILAILSRVSDGSWGVSGLGEVPVQGIENILCEGVEGHLKWRGLMGRSLRLCHAPGVRQGNIGIQMATNTKDIDNIDKNEQGISVSFERVPGDTAIDVSSTDSLSCYNQHP